MSGGEKSPAESPDMIAVLPVLRGLDLLDRPFTFTRTRWFSFSVNVKKTCLQRSTRTCRSYRCGVVAPLSVGGLARGSLCGHYMLNTKNEGILFIFSLFCENITLEYVRIHVIYRVNQAEYVIHMLVVAPQEYVNIYPARRVWTLLTC